MTERMSTLQRLIPALIIMIACSDPSAPPPAVPSTIVLMPSAVTLRSIGQRLQIGATVKDQNGVALATPVSWTTSDASVASVSAEGAIVAVNNGSAAVTAAVGSMTATVAVTVAQEPRAVTITPSAITIASLGTTKSLTAAVADSGGTSMPDHPVQWTSNNAEVAAVSESGVVTAVKVGTTTITATAGSVSGAAAIVVWDNRAPVVEQIDPFLSTPASGYIWEMPVLVIRYLPTRDGITLDQGLTGFPKPPSQGGPAATLDDVRERIDVLDRRVKFMLEEGTRFRGYADPSARPSLGYRIVQYLTIYDSLPVGPTHAPCEPSWCQGFEHFPDYHEILQRADAEYWVNQRGVKEVWVWGYHWGGMSQPESNMSSPTTGDISNSYRWNDDLPVYNTTYIVYGYNFGRLQNEAVHNHGHQLEAILAHADHLQNGNTDLFWNSFVGGFDGGRFVQGRAGSTHFPPNAVGDYDYWNPTPVVSDIDDWRPDNLGDKKLISRDRWRDLVYAWPAGNHPDVDQRPELFGQGSDSRTEGQWYIYWMQNMPGFDNRIAHFAGNMTNWWAFTADWDAAIETRTGLSTVPNGVPISIRNDFHGGILLIPSGGLEPAQSLTIYATAPVEIGVWDCGEPGATGCIVDKYNLAPGKNYRVIEHPNGPPNNLTVVEQ